MSASILGPNGHRMVELGGERAWLQRVLHGFVCSLQWIDIGGEAPEACMCLFREGRTLDASAYVVPQRNAWAYATNKGHATPALMGLAFKACAQMGSLPDKSTIKNLMDIVIEAIPDLVKMPSDQPASLEVARAVLGIQATARVNGRKVNEELL